jgi:small subunit ribosomal protein S6
MEMSISNILRDKSFVNYETVFILNPALSEEQVQKAVDKYEKYLKSNGSKIIAKEIWGLKKLAYTIQNKNSGFYNLIEYTAPADAVSSLEVEFSRDETIMRYLTVTLDKDALAWAEKRRNRNTKKAS